MFIRPTLVAVLLTVAAAAPAQTDQRNPAAAAKAFSLDLATPSPATPAPATPPPAASSAEPTADPSAAEPDPSRLPTAAFTLDTPIARLIADPRAKAVIDADLPGLSGDANLDKFQALSLRQFQPMTGGQMSDALLAKAAQDLAAIGPVPATLAPALPPTLPQPLPSVESSGHKRIDSGR